jgi:hypothetical protein
VISDERALRGVVQAWRPPAGTAFVLVVHCLGVTVKITALIVVLLALAMATGGTMVVSIHKEPVLLACGGPSC